MTHSIEVLCQSHLQTCVASLQLDSHLFGSLPNIPCYHLYYISCDRHSITTTSRCTHKPGPQSKARTCSLLLVAESVLSSKLSSLLGMAGRHMVRLLIPPMFSINPSRPLLAKWLLRRMRSRNGTRGAPCPPTLMSAKRKSPTVAMPVSHAMVEGSPICNVDETVWPKST